MAKADEVDTEERLMIGGVRSTALIVKNPDAKLIALCNKLEFAIQNFVTLWDVFAKAEREKASKKALDTAERAQSKANNKAIAIADQMLAFRPQTFEGLMALMRAASWTTWGNENPDVFRETDMPRGTGDTHARNLLNIGRAVYRLWNAVKKPKGKAEQDSKDLQCPLQGRA